MEINKQCEIVTFPSNGKASNGSQVSENKFVKTPIGNFSFDFILIIIILILLFTNKD